MKMLPYRARTATGDTFDIEFPLHSETGDPVKVGQLISVLLEAIENEMAVMGETSNGDVLQAVAMTMAIRGGMIHAPLETGASLAKDLLSTAFDAMAEASIHRAQSGRA
jgi:hypothetical protein